MTEITPLPALSDNYIWALCGSDGATVVVDPGQAAPVEHFLDEPGRRLTGILITHHHPDHTGGITELVKRHGAPVWGPATERIPECTHGVGAGDRLALPGLHLELAVMDIPGHTSGHVAYTGHGMLFSGDTLFAAGCGRVFEGTPAQMRQSLAAMRELDGETWIYCGHEYTEKNLQFAQAVEPENNAIRKRAEALAAQRANGLASLPARMADEWATNPFLRWDEPAVMDAARRRDGDEAAADPNAVFATIRAWKNGF